MLAFVTHYPKSAALLFGVLAATGFEPLSLWPLTIVSMAALLLLVDQAPNAKTAFMRGWTFGLGHFTVGLNWIAHAFTFQEEMPHWFGYGAVVLLSLYLAIFPALASLGAWWLRRKFHSDDSIFRLPASILLFAGCWIASELLRATLFTGFAWNPLGVIWLPTGVAIASTVIGTYGLGALVLLASGALLGISQRRFRLAAILAIPLCCLALWGHFSPAPPTPNGAPLVRVVQPNIGQDQKYSAEQEMANFEKLAHLSGTARPAPRLIFWPEAAISAYLDMEPDWRHRLAALLGPNDLLMTGGDKIYFENVEQDGQVKSVLSGANNSLWIVTPQATIAGRYDKAHLVPYGEYLPMRSLLEPIGLSRLVPGSTDFWPGPGPQSLKLPANIARPDVNMGVQICYEIIFSGQVIDRRNRPEFLFNPSNDAWFGSWGPVQHLAQARLRALEEGLPIIRSTPTGVSAIVDARGKIVASLGLNRAGFLDSQLPPPLPPTLFSYVGNWAPIILMFLLLSAPIVMRYGRN